MKKCKKLLSMLLAMIMMLSCFSVAGSAYQAYDDSAEAVYTTNDKGLATLLTDEQRASFVCDIINDLLASINIYYPVKVLGATIITIDLTTLDKTTETINKLSGLISAGDSLGVDLGILGKLDLRTVDKTHLSNGDGAVTTLNELLEFLDANAYNDRLLSVLTDGISLGVINVGDLSAINEIVMDLPGFLGETLYNLGKREITNGVGNDLEWANSTPWEDLETKPTFDSILVNLLKKLLLQPNHTMNATKAEDNDIIANPAKYGAEGMLHVEEETGYYYIYGTRSSTGTWTFTKESTESDKDGNPTDKHYVLTWDPSSALLSNFDESNFDLTGKSLYALLGDILPWAYNQFAAPNLDGQLRATLMQFAGAFNDGAKVTDEAKAQLDALIDEYKGVRYDQGEAALSNKFAATIGHAGNNNFMYFSLSGKDISTMPDDLYYVVDWDGHREYYKVDYTNVTGENLALFQMINWEWQAPFFAEIAPTGWSGTTDSALANITDAIGKILDEAVVDLAWTNDAANEDNAHFTDNVISLVKRVINAAPKKIMGSSFSYTAEQINAMGNEETLVMIADDILFWLMPSLVLPEDVTSLEEIVVYAVREFIAEIMPEFSWDAKIAAAKTAADKEAAFLDIALSMGTSIGAYYLREVMALGTVTDGSGKTSVATVKYGPDCTWQETLNYVVDAVIAMWLPDLLTVIKSNYPASFASTDGLAKLSAVLNSILPDLLSLVSGASGSITVGDKTDNFAVDLRVVKDLLAGILDLDLASLVNKLIRNSSSTANQSVYACVVAILKNLFGGLGLRGATDFSMCEDALDTALANTTDKIGALISDTSLQNLLRGLIRSLYARRDVWVQDLLTILIQLTGNMDEIKYNGTTLTTDKVDYYGNATATVTPTITVNTSGIKGAWYQSGYRTGTFSQDSTYSAKLTKLEIVDVAGTVVATSSPNAALTLNEPYTAAALSFTVGEAAAYYIKSYVTLTTPYNTTLEVKGSVGFIACSSAKGDEATYQWHDNGNYCGVTYWNTYIDKNESLTKAESIEMSVKTDDSKPHGFGIGGYGTVTKNADGSVTLNSHTAGSAYWDIYFDGGSEATRSNASDYVVPFYWGWNNSYDTSEGKSIPKESTGYGKQWYVDETHKRSEYTNDFITCKFGGNWQSSGKKGGFIGIGAKWKVENSTMGTPYIVLYNSYGLKSLVDGELGSVRTAEDYTTASWNTYVAALKDAVAVYYAPRSAATFASSNMVNGVSKFKTASETLEAAIKGLEAVNDTTASSTGYDVETQAALDNLLTVLNAESAKKLSNKNYYMYTWLKYYDVRAALSTLYTSTTIPSGVADSYLEGVPAKLIADAKAAAPAEYAAFIDAMTKAPTEDAQKAAEEARATFLKNLPVVDLDNLSIMLAKLNQASGRRIQDASYVYYLNDAIKFCDGKVGHAETNAAYTAESWAKYVEEYNDAEKANSTSSLPALIHESRYNLLVAYKGLVKADDNADFTALQTALAKAQELLAADKATLNLTDAAINEGYDVDKALADVFAAVGYDVKLTDAVLGDEVTYTIGGENTATAMLKKVGLLSAASAQGDVDIVTAKLNKAIDLFKAAAAPELNLSELGATVGALINSTSACTGGEGFVYGIDDIANLNTHFATPAGSIRVTANANGQNSTGAKVELLDTDGTTVLGTYYLVYFGDVNGDGWVDGIDVSLIDGVAAYMDFSYGAGDGTVEAMSSDINGDGWIDGIDVSDVDAVASYMAFPTQAEYAATVDAALKANG